MKIHFFLTVLTLVALPLHSALAKDQECEVIRRENKIPRGALEPAEKRATIVQTASGAEVHTAKDAAQVTPLGALGDRAGHSDESHLYVEQGSDEIQFQFRTSFYLDYFYVLKGKYCSELYQKNKDQLTRDLWAIYAANDEGKAIRLHPDLSQDEFKKLVSGEASGCPKADLTALMGLSEKADKEKYKACGTSAAKELIYFESQHISFGMKDFLKDKVDMISHPRKYFTGGANKSFNDEGMNALYEVENGYFRKDGDCWQKEKNRLKLDACLEASKSNNQNASQATVKTNEKLEKSMPASYEQLNADTQQQAEHPQIHSGPMAVPQK